ncbi:hypothetical protein FGO68_gene15469 [Halteria grandinella]|uniref:EH domain-containing protein n=1 Tax=Halteria grandinella TaxID=5974 RepID=A0A8J8NX19_HALGN|nr:hypothetical protein FGO68_gene15469 [Halteria grandinella]
MQADPSGNNKVGGKEGVGFFKRSGLEKDVLRNIWLLAAKTSNEYLMRDEFYLALRLIAYAQNGIQPTEESIRFNLEAPLPKFDPVPLALPPSEPGLQNTQIKRQQQPTAEEIAKHIPDLDKLNIDALNQLHSLIPSVNQAEQEKMQLNQQQQMMRQQEMMLKQMMQQARQSPWYIQQDDIQRYQKIFGSFDQGGQGFLTSEQMRSVMDQTKLEKHICDHVWAMVNPKGMDRFDVRMFAMAMHFLYNKKKHGDGMNLPGAIPEETIMSIDPENYMKMKQQMMNMRQPMQNPAQQMQQQPQVPKQVQPQQAPPQQDMKPPHMQSNDLMSFDQPPKQQPQQQLDVDNLLGGMQQQPPQPHKGMSPVKANHQIQPNIAMSPQVHHPQQQPHQLQTPPTRIDPSRIAQRREEVAFLTQVHKQDQTLHNEILQENARLTKQLEDLDREFAQLKVKIEQQRVLLQQDKSKQGTLRSQVDDKQHQIGVHRQTLESLMGERISQHQESHYAESYQAPAMPRRDSYATQQQQQYQTYSQPQARTSTVSQEQASSYTGYDYGGVPANNSNLYDYYQNSYAANEGFGAGSSQPFGGAQQQSHYQQEVHVAPKQPEPVTTSSVPSGGNFAMRFDFDNFDSELGSIGGAAAHQSAPGNADAGNFDLGGTFDFS